MSDFRENYFKARDAVAQELKEKYNLVESYKDENRLTLDSSTHSIHLTFYVPDGEGVSISDKGKEPGYGQSLMELLHQQYSDIDTMTKVFIEHSQIVEKSYPNASPAYLNLSVMIYFIEKSFPLFLV